MGATIWVQQYGWKYNYTAHIDAHHLFDNQISIISFGSGCEMIFSNKRNIRKFYIPHCSIFL
jgi:hypothetical protein